MNWHRQAAWLAWVIAPAAGLADVRVVTLPAAAQARGLDLLAGDVLRLGDDPAALDVWRWLQLEALDASAGPVQLSRQRAGVWSPIRMPPGRWDVLVAPAVDDPAQVAPLALLAAQQAALDRDFTATQARFEQAATQSPDHAGWIALAAARAYENHPDRSQPLRAADQAVAVLDVAAAAPLQRAAALVQQAFWRGQTRDNAGAATAAGRAVKLAGDTLIAAQAHLVLAFVALRGGQPDQAGIELDKAAALIRAIAPDGLDDASLQARLATLQAVRREGDAAGLSYERAINTLRRLAPGSMLLGRTLFNAHLHALERRRYAQAESLAQEALSVFTTTAPDSLERSQARAALAEVLMRRTEHAAAEVLLREALAASSALDPDSYEALSLKLQLADNLDRQSQHLAALQLEDELVQRLRSADAPSALLQTTLPADLALYRGIALKALGRCAEAMLGSQSALDGYAALGRTGAQVFEAHLLASDCSRQLGDLPLAREHAERARAGFVAMSADGVQQATAYVALARVARAQDDRALAIQHYRTAIAALEQHRARVGGSEDVQARWSAQFQDVYKELMWLLDEAGDPAAVAELDARYRQQTLLQLLGADHPQLDAAWSGRMADDDVATLALPTDSALLSFVVGESGTLVLLHNSSSPVVQTRRLEINQTTLAAAVDRMLLLGSRPSTDARVSAALAEQAAELYQQLLAPLQPQIGAYRRWVIVADGPLLRLPWPALVVAGTSELRYLVEDRVLTVAPSAAVLAQLQRVHASDDSILAFADPVADPTGAGAMRAVAGDALPGARSEVQALARLFPDQVSSWIGADASEARVRELAPRAGTIHFALHSVIDPLEPMASHIVLSAGVAQGKTDDGMLRADEIAGELKLGADLVVLSSCASALGRQAGGAGLLGLVRALHLAGARAVVGTTWPVADRSTASLMVGFYQHRRAGQASDAALALAQRQWLADARADRWGDTWARWWGSADALPEAADHPFYWAGFVYSGASGP